ncbi:MAG: NAD(P)-dependent oxidoreductase [Rhodospirillaceae bacterium]|jgi:putative dehydrogenase|nr:NAD(P)-dependent oxidoreductase [Rhodospirillaceae bacterium]
MTQPSDTVTSVAVLGLGIMGSALARHLVADGFDVRGFDPDHVAAQRARDSGVQVASTVLEAVQDVACILTSLPSESALVSTINALTNHPSDQKAKAVLVELSTLSIAAKLEARDRLIDCGFDMLDCPVSGTGAQAQTKDIVLYASGEEEPFKSCQPVFDAVARESFFLGKFGNGTRMKFIANLLVAVHNVASAEALALATKAGLDPQQVFDVISSGAGASRILELRGPMMVEENYSPPSMKLDVWQKDMKLIHDFAEQMGALTPLFDATRPVYESANQLGLGEQDTAAVFEVLKR